MRGFPPGVHLIGGQVSAAVNAQLAREFYADILPIVVELRRQGMSLRAIAAELDGRGIKTRQGWDRWSANQVRRVLLRATSNPTNPTKNGALPIAKLCCGAVTTAMPTASLDKLLW